MSEVRTEAPEKKESFLEASLQSAEEVNGKDNPSILGPLNDVAEYHLLKRNYERANELLQRAAAIEEGESPSSPEKVKLARQKLGWSKFLQEKFDEAETYFLQAFEVMITDQNASEEGIGQALRTLIYFYLKTGNLADADDSLKKLLNVYQQPNHESSYQVAYAIVALGVIAEARGAGDESAQYMEKAAAIVKDKCAIGYTVDYLSLSEIINLYFQQDRKLEAQELCMCTMLENEDLFWPHNPVAGEVLSSLAEFMRAQKKFKQAESLYKRAILIKQRSSVPGDPLLSQLALSLSNMYLGLRKYADAEPLIKDALKSRVVQFGVYHPSVAACVETYATILRKTKRVSLANRLDTRAREIRLACVAKLDKEVAAAAAAVAKM